MRQPPSSSAVVRYSDLCRSLTSSVRSRLMLYAGPQFARENFLRPAICTRVLPGTTAIAIASAQQIRECESSFMPIGILAPLGIQKKLTRVNRE